MIGIFLVMIGLFISTVDIPIMMIADYPVYNIVYKDDGMGEVIQEYVARNMLGDGITLDVLPDVLGYLFILVGISMLIRYNLQFLRLYIPILATGALSVFVKLTPFYYEEKSLIVTALSISFIQLVIEIIMERRLVYTIADSTSDLPNERDTVLMKFGWIGSAICRVFIYFIVLVGLADWIVIIYTIAQIGFMIFCLDRMFRCRHYLHLK
ncbi:MAG: hypothetical protein E7267_00025 [Lachnospiraceae bacterium]|nr:hypothetical protein [Lachnospiraceae bacterium]